MPKGLGTSKRDLFRTVRLQHGRHARAQCSRGIAAEQLADLVQMAGQPLALAHHGEPLTLRGHRALSRSILPLPQWVPRTQSVGREAVRRQSKVRHRYSNLSGLIGKSRTRVPVAWKTALAIAGGAPTVADSPTPLAPSGWCGDGVTV